MRLRNQSEKLQVLTVTDVRDQDVGHGNKMIREINNSKNSVRNLSLRASLSILLESKR